jgi:flavin reductase (DIM6/NTAB) family NADH-FMN oxidoreductase RutF
VSKKSFEDYYDIVLKNISKGAFLTVASDERINTMTIGWGSLGHLWGKPIFMIMVRKSRYTYQLIEKSNEFTVTLPEDNDLKKELIYCGRNSGRDINKFEVCGLTPVKGRLVKTPIIGEGKIHFECQVVYKQEMDPVNLNLEYMNKWYPDEDYHCIYYGEVLSVYQTK